MVFKKCRETDDVLFVDASKCFAKGKTENFLRPTDIDRIVSAYRERKNEERFSHLAGLREIADNAYNLNIPRYVESFESEAEISLPTVARELAKIDAEIESIDDKIRSFCAELGLEAPVCPKR